MLRREVVAIAEKNPEYGKCGTCKHYQHLMTCGECSRGSRYCFDWKEYEKRLQEKAVETANKKKAEENSLRQKIVDLLYNNNIQVDQGIEGLADDIVKVFDNSLEKPKKVLQEMAEKYQKMALDDENSRAVKNVALEVAASYAHAHLIISKGE